MSVFKNELDLPGTLTEVVSEYSYGYDTTKFGTTNSVVLIGTAFDGPSGAIVPIYSPEHGRYVFGKAYDYKTKREASLTAAIRDAYDGGCRTIYAMRVGGKEMFKDYDFCFETENKLRVSSTYPSNLGKDVYMLYSNVPGNQTVTIYKPASRATIQERVSGLVESESAVLAIEIRLDRDYGLGRDATLQDVLTVINEHPFNNVLKLSIVNADGFEVTQTVEAGDYRVGGMFPGLYTIGRGGSLIEPLTDIDFFLTASATSTPYESFDGVFFRVLNYNSDVLQSVPIYAENMDDLRTALLKEGVSMTKSWDFLNTAGVIDYVFAKDDVDYEEVGMSAFEIYKRLGSGFAVCAKAERRVDGAGNEITPKVREAAMDDTNRIKAFTDGLYSIMENHNVRHRVLVCGSMDDVLEDRIPRPSDFKNAAAQTSLVMEDLLRVTPKVGADEMVRPKHFSIRFEEVTNGVVDNFNDIYTDSVLEIVPGVPDIAVYAADVFEPGTKVMQMNPVTHEGVLYTYVDDAFSKMTGAGLVGKLVIVDGLVYKGIASGTSDVIFTAEAMTPSTVTPGLATYTDKAGALKEYFLVQGKTNVFCMQIMDKTVGGKDVSSLGDVTSMLDEDSDGLLVYAQTNHIEKNRILVRSAAFGSYTLKEFVEAMNAHPAVKDLFTFELTAAGYLQADSYLNDVLADLTTPMTLADLSLKEYDLGQDRKIGWDYNLYIPYKTTDNFARQLAQHCAYTSIKSAPCHGYIGASRMIGTNLTSVANKVNSLCELNFDMYAKNEMGRNMLDRNNLPYPIGRNCSTIFMQYFCTLDDGYKFISNGAARYAGLVSQLVLTTSSTNAVIPGISPMFNLSTVQLSKLIKKSIVSPRENTVKGWVVSDGITQASSTTAFHRLSSCRTQWAVEEVLREACDPFIGQQNTAAAQNSLKTAIDSGLAKLVGSLIKPKYNFTIRSGATIDTINILDIEYDITPINEIRNIRNAINVKRQ